MYVVRDKDGDLWLFTSKPVRVKERLNHEEYEYWEKPEYPDDGDDAYDVIYVDSKLFPELKWEDEPIEVKLVEVRKEE